MWRTCISHHRSFVLPDSFREKQACFLLPESWLLRVWSNFNQSFGQIEHPYLTLLDILIRVSLIEIQRSGGCLFQEKSMYLKLIVLTSISLIFAQFLRFFKVNLKLRTTFGIKYVVISKLHCCWILYWMESHSSKRRIGYCWTNNRVPKELLI